jgi:hypothetical protein
MEAMYFVAGCVFLAVSGAIVTWLRSRGPPRKRGTHAGTS